jgi:hypothetical protein
MAGVANATAATAIPRVIFLMGPPSESVTVLSQRSCQFFNTKIANGRDPSASTSSRIMLFAAIPLRPAEAVYSSNIEDFSVFGVKKELEFRPVA